MSKFKLLLYLFLIFILLLLIIIIKIVDIKSSFKSSIIMMINDNDMIIKNNNNIEDNDTFSNVNNHDTDCIWKIIQEEEIFLFLRCFIIWKTETFLCQIIAGRLK